MPDPIRLLINQFLWFARGAASLGSHSIKVRVELAGGSLVL